MESTRRQFIQVAATTIAGGALAACGTSKDSSGTKDATTSEDTGGVVHDASDEPIDATARDASSTDRGAVDTGGTTAACASDAPGVTIGSNHGHSLSVSVADVAAGTDKTYSIRGTATHSHDVTVTAADFTALKNGQRVSIVSTHDHATHHTHTVELECP